MRYKLFSTHDPRENEFQNRTLNDLGNRSDYPNENHWFEFEMLPYYSEIYWGVSDMSASTFEELWFDFLEGNDNARIGSISIIAKVFPIELYTKLILDHKNLDKNHRSFLIKNVVPDYLPLLIDRNKVRDFNFPSKYNDDIWIRILKTLLENSK